MSQPDDCVDLLIQFSLTRVDDDLSPLQKCDRYHGHSRPFLQYSLLQFGYHNFRRLA